jgi:hypothetical protein
MFGLGIVLGGWGRSGVGANQKSGQGLGGKDRMRIGNGGDLSGNLRGIEIENRSSFTICILV